MTEKRFRQWLIAVCKNYLIAIRDGKSGDLRRRSLHILIRQTCFFDSQEIDDIFGNLDKNICLEIDKLNTDENLDIYAKALFDLIMRRFIGVTENHKYVINNIIPR